MADITSDDDLDSAAMAEAMGFTGFGMQRANRKRKLTPPAQTGANNAPLGKRRPLNLPEPVSGDASGANADEIGLDDDDDDGGAGLARDQQGGGEEFDADAAGPQYIDTSRPSRGYYPEELEDMQTQARIDALTFADAPSTTGHHQLPQKPPQQQGQHAGKAARWSGGRAGSGLPWWEGEWDPRLIDRMVENPWERLEKQRGLEARGTWPSKDRGAAVLAGAGSSGPLGGSEATQATMS
ncbi:hypothetical protein N8I77_003621 [Diaporthe amygdali]|uniref:Uncharacterized protein n=1 Tax=Phomopsis amygdali TaxID=1214568 RepID=A0AAD9SJ75_PHOAM|nr:hypothetical protein N8I77_003621 [Diaporthe amygdali]